MHALVWRVVPIAVPTWPVRCTRCGAPELESTERFRVNANGPLHDVWLIYRCPRCGLPRKRSILRRIRESASGSLGSFRHSDPQTAVRWAFELSRGVPAAYRVDRPPLTLPTVLDVRIEQPVACSARWDVFLARELGCSRSHVRSAWRSGALLVAPAVRPRSAIRDGDRFRTRLDGAGRMTIP